MHLKKVKGKGKLDDPEVDVFTYILLSLLYNIRFIFYLYVIMHFFMIRDANISNKQNIFFKCMFTIFLMHL